MEKRCEMGLHDFRIIGDDSKVRAEECRLCGKKKIFNKDGHGRIDQKEYAKAHEADFLQPFGESTKKFHQVYGEK